jgi:putative heme-binding domain-containing protein
MNGPEGASIARLFDDAARLAAGDGPEPARVAMVRLLGLGPLDRAFAVLPDRLDPREPTAVQLAAVQALGELPDRRVGPAIAARWRALSPSVRREAVEVLFARPDRLGALLDAMESKTIAPSDVEPVRVKALLAIRDAAIRARASKLFAGAASPGSDRSAVVAAFRSAAERAGDRDRGRAVFRKACATCHRAEGQGTDVGPNLATVAGRSPDDLLVHILDPNREVAPNYVNYTVATTDGLIATGLIAEESANAVVLKRAEGVTDVVPRSRIDSIASTGLSLMPEGLEKGFEPGDFADLIAYVRGIH